jgi:hypothetical protein
VLSFGVMLVFWFVSNFITRDGNGGMGSIWLAVMFGFLTYPVFWWLAKMWDRITERMRYRAAKKKFLSEMQARANSYAQQASAPAAAPQVETPPEANPA